MKWLAYSIATLILWGAWGVLLKIASEGRDWKQVYVTTNLAIVAMVAALLIYYRGQVLIRGWEGLVALAAGFAGTLGFVAMVLALSSGGKASIVIPLTSAYPAVTVLLSRIMLGEELGVLKTIGVVLVLVGVAILSK